MECFKILKEFLNVDANKLFQLMTCPKREITEQNKTKM